MPDVQISPMLRIPHLCLAENLDSTLPLEYTEVHVQITGPVAVVVVTQRFGNPLKEPAELDYLFPLPENAAISGFELKIGSRRIEGDLQEREAARAAYEDARGQGRRAGLFEQRRLNLFAMRLANVRPGETIHATLRYQQRLKFEENVLETGGGYEFVFPMGVTPKYDSPQHPDEGQGVHPPLAKAGEKIGPVEITLAVDAGLRAGEPVSPSHPIETTRVDERRFQVRLAGEQIPDHDFVLRWPVTGTQTRAASWSSGEPGQAFFLATLLPPRMDQVALAAAEPLQSAQPREFIFVLDRSGSMSGQPILQARNALRACLRALNPEDTFRILLFDNALEWFQKEPAPVTQEQVNKADSYLDKVQGRGGTEIVAALEAALGQPADSKRTRFVVFLTDGAVSAEERVLQGVRGKIGAARLFTFGIGPSVNRALLSRMASLGRGRSEFLQLDEDIEGAIIRFQDSVSFPALTDLSLEWQNGKAWDVYPAHLPDLYYGQPLEICGRVAHSGKEPVLLTVRGKQAGQPVTLQLNLPEPAGSHPGGEDPALRWIWAQARLEDLEEQRALDTTRAEKLRSEILGLALEYNLISVFTSFVAVDQEEAAPGGQSRIIHVAQPLPQGLEPEGFTYGAPGAGQLRQAMAMPAAFMPSSPPPAAARMPNQVSETDGNFFKTLKRAIAPGRADVSEPADSETRLRELARTQNINGAWGDDVEQTAVALLAFVRSGHTPHTGSYRQALRRAVRWLVDHPGQGFASFIRARALMELAEATKDDSDRQSAQAARQGLPEPKGTLEAAALGQAVNVPGAIHSLDDLRQAGLLKTSLPVPREMQKDKQAALVRAWMALL